MVDHEELGHLAESGQAHVDTDRRVVDRLLSREVERRLTLEDLCPLRGPRDTDDPFSLIELVHAPPRPPTPQGRARELRLAPLELRPGARREAVPVASDAPGA